MTQEDAERKLKSGRDFQDYALSQPECVSSRQTGSHVIVKFVNGIVIVFCGHGNKDIGKGLKLKWLRLMMAAEILLTISFYFYYTPILKVI